MACRYYVTFPYLLLLFISSVQSHQLGRKDNYCKSILWVQYKKELYISSSTPHHIAGKESVGEAIQRAMLCTYLDTYDNEEVGEV